MRSQRRIRVRNSIATKLLRVVFSLYLVIAVAVTVAHMVMEYRYQRSNISHDLEDIQKTFERGLAIDMWHLNEESLRSRVEGMLEIPVIVGVKIKNANGADVAVGGVIAHGDVVGIVGQRVDLLGLSPEETEIGEDERYTLGVFMHRFPIVYAHEEETRQLGEATIYSNTSVIYRRVKLGFLLLVINAVVKTAALWVIFLWFSTFLLRRPLAALAAATENVSLENLDSFRVRIETSGRNELKVLEESFNSMIGNLHQSLCERKHAEEAMRQSEQQYRSLVQNIPGLVYRCKLKTPWRVEQMSEGALDLCGYPASSFLEGGLDYGDLVLPDDMPVVKRAVEAGVAAHQPYGVEYRIRHRQGSVRFVNEQGRAIYDEHGKPLWLEGVILDITERKRVEEEMGRLRLLLKNMIDSMPSSLVAVDAEGRVTHWNRKAEEVTGVSLEEAEGQPLAKVFPALEVQLAQVREAIRQRETKSAEKVESYTNGERRLSDVMVYPLVSNGVEGAVIRVDDVTERVHLEEMMIQSEKMMSVGGLAAGMAHEINNPLSGILQNIQVVLDRLSTDLPANVDAARDVGIDLAVLSAYMDRRKIIDMLESVRKSGERAARIVENMLSFSRKGDANVIPHDLGELLDKTVELAGSDYDLKKKYDFKQIEIVREYAPDLPEVPCEATKIQQVFLNLLKNGAQAMAEPADPTKPPRFILRTLREGDMARIEVEDSGPGVSEDVRKRLFEPFFTTKEVGTGLGLSVSYFIVTENHGGTMVVESTLGQGAKFVIRLPLQRGT